MLSLNSYLYPCADTRWVRNPTFLILQHSIDRHCTWIGCQAAAKFTHRPLGFQCNISPRITIGCWDHRPVVLFTSITLIPAWASNDTNHKVWGVITYPFPNLNGSMEWMNNILSHALMGMCWPVHAEIKLQLSITVNWVLPIRYSWHFGPW